MSSTFYASYRICYMKVVDVRENCMMGELSTNQYTTKVMVSPNILHMNMSLLPDY